MKLLNMCPGCLKNYTELLERLEDKEKKKQNNVKWTDEIR